MNTQLETERAQRSWLYAWWPVLLGVALIATSSSNAFSAQHTSGPFRWLYEALFGHISNAQWPIVHKYIRKGFHFIGYGVFGLFWLRAWRITRPEFRFFQDALLALLGAGLVASIDEFHQAFLAQRTGSPWDVLLDCCGVVFMQLVVYIAIRILRPGSWSTPPESDSLR
ncbi:MAG TPA: VanZ family protein [Terracidiphilus sp.]|nr:VanZ family protein [Terracidiphilus sp.]